MIERDRHLESDAPATPSVGAEHLDRIRTLAPWGTFVGEHRSRNDEDTEKWLHQSEYNNDDRLRRHVIEIERETEQLRWAGKLKLFIEGEPIGAAPKPRRQRKLTPAQVRARHNQRMQWRQEALLALRRKNNLALRGIR